MKKAILVVLAIIIGLGLTLLYSYFKVISERNAVKFAGAGPSEFQSKNVTAQYSSAPPDSRPSEQSGTAEAAVIQREPDKTKLKIIKNGNIRFQVKDLAQSKKAIYHAIEQNSAYIANETETKSGNLQIDMTIRVPFQYFDVLVNSILTQSIYLDSRTITAEEVTAQFVDMSARLQAKKEVERRYYEILKQARNVKEILEVEEQIASMREEIDALEGKLRLLNDQIMFSTIVVSFYQVVEPSAPPPTVKQSYLKNMGRAFIAGWKTFLEFVTDLISIWPFVILIVLIYFFIRRVWRRRIKQA